MKTNDTDEQLMQLIGRGDQEAFRELYGRHARRLQGFFLRMLEHDSDKAADFTQELFMKVYEQRRRFDARQSDFTTWLYAIAYNLCKNEYRHLEIVRTHRDEQIGRNENSIPEKECNYDKEQRRSQLRKSITSLPTEQRDAFILRYQEELSVKEIAHILNVPEGTVKSRLHYALLKVQKEMKPFK